MHAQILSAPPISGSIPERSYDACGDCVWVRFHEGNSREWAGVFGASGLTTGASVTLFDDDHSAFVIARGQGYIVGTGSGELQHRTECDYLVEALAIPQRDLVVACDLTGLFAYSGTGLVWRSMRIALDGIKLERATSEELGGSLWVGSDWRPFRLGLADWYFREGPWEAWTWLQRT